MTIEIRPAKSSDLGALSGLLLAGAEERCARGGGLWKLDGNPGEKLRSMIEAALGAEKPPFRQQWLVAKSDGAIVGAAHSILLPVPPIYAGDFRPPGLIMEDCVVAPDAPQGTRGALLTAAEADLTDAGARILLASSQAGGAWESEYADRGYRPLTMYFAKTDPGRESAFADVRKAEPADVPAIVAASAVSRAILFRLDPFWKPHADAGKRFEAWMTRSLTLDDRDMFVSEAEGRLQGYAISQPATPLHFPAPHDTSRLGIIDDFHHEDLADPERLRGTGAATALLHAAEAARGRRGNDAVLVVCPAAWTSKAALLTRAGYRNAITWFIKAPGGY